MDDHLEADEPQLLESSSSPWLNMVQMIWRRRWLLVLGAFVGCTIGGLYYSRAAAIYQSSAQVLVVKKSPDALPVSSSESSRLTATDDYLSTHQTLIRSPVVVGDAIRQANLASLPSFAGREDLTSDIIAALKVSRETNAGNPTSILNISFRCRGAKDSAAVVTAVIESYQRFLSSKYKDVANETADLIAKGNDILEKKLTAKQKEYDDFIVKQPAFWRNKEGVTPIQERLASLEAKRSALLLQEADIVGRLAAFEKALKEGRHSRAELVAILSQTPRQMSGEGGGMTLEERLMTLELQEKNLLEDYAEDHPQVRTVRDQLRLVRARMRGVEDSAGGENSSVDPVKTHIQTLKLELENTRMAAEALARLIQEEQQKAEPLRGFEKKDESYRLEIARSQQLFDAIAKRLDEVSILKNFAGGYEAEIIAPPRVGIKVYPKPLAVFASALILGLLAGFGLAYLAELSDQSFRTPEEIRRQLGLPVVGHIPFFDTNEDEELPVTEGPQLAPVLRTVYHPKSREAEAYRGVRTALFFNSRDDGHTIIQVTSPDMGDGKSTLTANLAVSIAQSAKKVLLIDADFRRPRVHKLFDVSPRQGLASVMNGEAELDDVIQSTAIPHLSLLPCGPIPPNPAELLTLPRFHELLDYVRERYDYVLLDTPPLLAVTDPAVIVPYVDGVILTVRISKNARPHARRAKEILTTLGASMLGVVVNGVGRDAKGYGYDGYRYGYTYKYYNDYSSYEQDADDSSQAGGEDAPREKGALATAKKKARSPRSSRKKSSFFTWLFS